MQNEVKKYRYITIWEDHTYPDVLFSTYQPQLEIDIEIAKELIESRLDYSKGRQMFVVIDFTHVKSVTKEARDYMNSKDGGLRGILGGAFLSNNVVATLFVNLYLKVSNPVIPAKFFTDRTEALKWLMKIRAKKTELV